MKLSNIFKDASPFVTNLVTLIVVICLFVQENQPQIESVFNNGTLSSVRFQNILAGIALIAGLFKAFSSTEGVKKSNWKQAIIPSVIKFLTYLTREEPEAETPVTDSGSLLPEPPAPPEKPTP